jgi:tripartite ATP-independent transporter DctP family solute receptor
LASKKAEKHPKEEAMSRSTKTLSRRNVLAASTAVPLIAILKRPAWAAEFNFKLATGQSIGQPINTRLSEAADRIREATSGRLEIRVFPANQLGSDTDLISQTRSGAVEILTIAGSVLSILVPAAALANVGFAFSNYDQVWRSMDGDLGTYIQNQITKAGILPLSKPADNSFRKITSASKPIRSPDDLSGYKIRVPVSPMFTSLFKAFGAGPTSINFNELYTALQTRVVDGQENGLVAIDAGKLYEVQKYCAETNHIWDPFWIVGNRRTFERLPADIKEVVQRELERAVFDQRADVVGLEASLKEDLTKKGLQFEVVDRSQFRAALQKTTFYREWREKFGEEAWKTLQAAVGELS